MEQIQIIKTNLLKAFNGADSNGKALLSDLFGKEIFSQKITDRVKTIADACNISGMELIVNPDDTEDEIAYKKLKIITKALNEGWTPDWSNSNQYKWYPYFKMSGFGFSGTLYDYSYTTADVGSRLCFKSSELAEYAGKQFEEIYKTLLT